jgi:hypothetical protein
MKERESIRANLYHVAHIRKQRGYREGGDEQCDVPQLYAELTVVLERPQHWVVLIQIVLLRRTSDTELIQQ